MYRHEEGLHGVHRQLRCNEHPKVWNVADDSAKTGYALCERERGLLQEKASYHLRVSHSQGDTPSECPKRNK